MTRYLPMDLRCPRCGAAPGIRCTVLATVEGVTFPTGRPARPHSERRAAVRAANTPRRTPGWTPPPPGWGAAATLLGLAVVTAVNPRWYR